MTEYDKNELAFLASRNELEMKFHQMREFLASTTPEKIGKARYENLFSVAGLGLMLILENKLMWDEIENLRGKIRRLDSEAIELLKQNNELMKK